MSLFTESVMLKGTIVPLLRKMLDRSHNTEFLSLFSMHCYRMQHHRLV